MDRTEQWREVAQNLYNVIGPIIRRDKHYLDCRCEMCLPAHAFWRLVDIETREAKERVPPMSMAMEFGKPLTYEQGQEFERRQAEPARQPTPEERELVRMYRETVKDAGTVSISEQATWAAIRTQNANLEAQIRAVPEEQRDQYHIRVQMHRDGTRTQHFERKDKRSGPCTCQACMRAMYSLDGLPFEDAITHLHKLAGTYYKDVSRLCLEAGDCKNL